MSNSPPTYEEIVRRVGAPVVAIVFGVGQYQGLAVLRALGRMGVPVYAVGEEKSVGFHSRYARTPLVSPDPHHDPEGLLNLLLSVGRRLKARGERAVLFPTRDSVVELIAKQQDALAEFFICHTPRADVIRNCASKEAQIRTARALAVPTPRTYFDNELELLYQDLSGGRSNYPLLFKPKRELPPEQLKAFRLITLSNERQLKEAVARAKQHDVPFLIQEIIPGADDTLYSLGSCLSKDGKMKAIFTGRKLRQRPPRFGECRVGESIYVEPIMRDGERLLRGLGFFGISQVEFKFDARDGQYKLLEVNPRSWSWISLPVAMGINIPFAFFCDACGIEIPTQTMTSQRVVYISLRDDLYWSLKGRDGVPWIHCFRGYEKIVEPFFSLDDPMPGLIYFKRAGMEFLGGLGRAFLRKLGLARRTSGQFAHDVTGN